MLKKVSKKSVLLFGAALALCALVMPSMASAASWSPPGTSSYTIDSPNIGFSVNVPAASGSSCGNTQFEVHVHNSGVATITGAAFRNCVGDIGTANGCTATATGTNFPWVATPVSTSNIQIHNIHIDVRFETRPPAGSVPCANNGADVTLTGTLSGVGYTPLTHTFDFAGATGLSAHFVGILGGIVAATRGVATPTGPLRVID